MRHVPGFDQGWRGYERQDKHPGSILDTGSPIKNVGDDRSKMKAENTAPKGNVPDQGSGDRRKTR